MFEKYADELCRKTAAEYLNKTPECLTTMDSVKKYDLQPFKKEDGKVYYYRSVLDEFVKKDL